MGDHEARYGWKSDFDEFRRRSSVEVRERIQAYYPDASYQQVRAWDESIEAMQEEITEIINQTESASRYETILEYELPMESRRTDAIFLVGGAVAILEFKSTSNPSQADIDQASAYGRDLKFYHRECWNSPVEVGLVSMGNQGWIGQRAGVNIFGPDHIDAFVNRIDRPVEAPIPSETFLNPEAYCPQPTLIQAARELMASGEIRAIHRARAATEPALKYISDTIHEAAANKERRLILLTGVPGAGKTLVGLQVVHAHFLDDLAVPRPNGKPGVPAIFLSGNGPLVEVLQYELQSAGGGRVFVRGVMDYVKRYSRNTDLIPPEHVLVFDEAQRAFDADQVREKHSRTPGFEGGQSEPEHFIEFAERIPDWCVVVGLIGGGQEIHIGEEGGVIQWRHAIENSPKRAEWKVHLPPIISSDFEGSNFPVEITSKLDLDVELRFHIAESLHTFVKHLLDGQEHETTKELGQKLATENYHLRITRDLEIAKNYLRDRYADFKEARYGILASSRDKALSQFGIPNGFQDTKNVRKGPWYGDEEDDESGKSCRHLNTCMTEFGAQGLELDAVILAWGTDFKRDGGKWSNNKARKYQHAHRVKDPFQLRLNAYRVLLTRARDATVVFVPPLGELDETYVYLVESGFLELT